jgi:hypothetical protein
MVHVGDAGAYRIEGLKWAHQCASWKDIDLDAVARGGGNRLRQANSAGVKARHIFRPIGNHF